MVRRLLQRYLTLTHEIRHGLTTNTAIDAGQTLSSNSKPNSSSVLKTFEKSLNGTAYENFSGSIANIATLATYRFSLCRFMMFRKVSHPDELLIGDHHKLLEARVIEWLQSLQKEGLSFDTRYTYKAAVQHFYVMNDIIMNWRKISKFVGKRERRNKDRAWNYEEIKKMLEKADERMRVVILLLASTGMRIGGVPRIRIGDLKKLSDYNSLYQIQVYSGEREEYTTFCSPECAAAIDSYLDFRIRCGEERDSKENLMPRAPLVREMFDTRDPFKAKHPRTVSEYTIAEALRVLAIKAGVRVPVTVGEYRKGSIRHDVAIDNGFRKFFDTKCHEARMDATIKQMLVGHTVGLEDNYLRPSDETMIAEYIKAVDLVTVNQALRLQKKVTELQQKLQDAPTIEMLKDTIANLSDQLMEMKEEVKRIKNRGQKIGKASL